MQPRFKQGESGIYFTVARKFKTGVTRRTTVGTEMRINGHQKEIFLSGKEQLTSVVNYIKFEIERTDII